MGILEQSKMPLLLTVRVYLYKDGDKYAVSWEGDDSINKQDMSKCLERASYFLSQLKKGSVINGGTIVGKQLLESKTP